MGEGGYLDNASYKRTSANHYTKVVQRRDTKESIRVRDKRTVTLLVRNTWREMNTLNIVELALTHHFEAVFTREIRKHPNITENGTYPLEFIVCGATNVLMGVANNCHHELSSLSLIQSWGKAVSQPLYGRLSFERR